MRISIIQLLASDRQPLHMSPYQHFQTSLEPYYLQWRGRRLNTGRTRNFNQFEVQAKTPFFDSAPTLFKRSTSMSHFSKRLISLFSFLLHDTSWSASGSAPESPHDLVMIGREHAEG